MLKADLHIHTSEDPLDYWFIKYSAMQLIDKAKELGFEVIAITLHNKILDDKEITRYAHKKGILLIPGCEKTIKKKHVLLYNVSQKEVDSINTLEDLKKIKKKDTLIIAPHPYFHRASCLGKELTKYIDTFDAIEYSHFYIKHINLNKKAVKTAKKYNKAIIGTSDAHYLYQLNHTYSLIKSDKTIQSVVQAIKNNKVSLVTKPLAFRYFSKIGLGVLSGMQQKLFK